MAEKEDIVTSMDERREYLNELVEKRGYVLDYHKVLAEQDFEALRALNGLLEADYLKERRLDRARQRNSSSF